MTALPSIFQNTITKSNTWIAEVKAELHTTDDRRALRALRAGLHALRDRLPPAEAVDLGAQLPMLIRGLYYEGWRLGERPPHGAEPATLLAAVRDELGDPTLRAEDAVRVTIRVLAAHVTEGELDDVAHALPRRLAELWADNLA